MAAESQHLLRRLVLTAVLAASVVAGLSAQESDDENAVVGQTLSWEGNGDALRYELIIDDASGKEIYHQSTESTTADLRLKPGTYRYQIQVYNVLDQVESQSGWQDLVVLKAEIPGPKKIDPAILYLENPVLKFHVQGILLVEGAQYKIYRQDKPDISAVGQVVAHTSDQEVELQFPDFEFSYGDYNLTIQNPGGLKHTLKNALAVRYEKPVDFHFSAGYAPLVVLYDDWYRTTWDKGFYPLGADARLTVMFLKKGDYQIGAELEGGAWMQTGGVEQATINSQYFTGGVNLVYSWLLTKQWRLMARAGGGLMAGFHAFDYQGTPGTAWNSVDPYASAGGGVYYAIFKFWYVEADVGLINGFGQGYMAGLLQPMVSTGLSF